MIGKTNSAVGGAGGDPEYQFKLAPPSPFTITAGDESIKVVWTDPGDLQIGGATIVTWAKTELRIKKGADFSKWSDGTLIGEYTTRGSHTITITAIGEDPIENDETYYIGVFPNGGGKNYTFEGCRKTAKPEEVKPTKITAWTAKGVSESIELAWTLPSDVEKLKVAYREKGTTAWSYSAFLAKTVSEYTIEDLVDETEYEVKLVGYNLKERTSDSDTLDVTPMSVKIVPWATGSSWEDIGNMVAAHYEGKINVQDHWSVGDTIKIKAVGNYNIFTITKFVFPTESIPSARLSVPIYNTSESRTADIYLTIADFEHDRLTTPIVTSGGISKTKACVTAFVSEMKFPTEIRNSRGTSDPSGDQQYFYNYLQDAGSMQVRAGSAGTYFCPATTSYEAGKSVGTPPSSSETEKDCRFSHTTTYLSYNSFIHNSLPSNLSDNIKKVNVECQCYNHAQSTIKQYTVDSSVFAFAPALPEIFPTSSMEASTISQYPWSSKVNRYALFSSTSNISKLNAWTPRYTSVTQSTRMTNTYYRPTTAEIAANTSYYYYILTRDVGRDSSYSNYALAYTRMPGPAATTQKNYLSTPTGSAGSVQMNYQFRPFFCL